MKRFFLMFFCLAPLVLMAASDEPSVSVQEHYDLGTQLLNQAKWGAAKRHFKVITSHYEETPFYNDALFYTGICHYFTAHFDLADKIFSKYLTMGGQLKHFERAFEFKYQIAEYYRQGSRKHMWGWKFFPRLSSGKDDAMLLYEEIIASLPAKEVAAKALYSKSLMLRKKRHYKESVEALQMLARRFPKSELSIDAYLLISEMYLERSYREGQNPDLIALAQVNLQKFHRSFPTATQLEGAEENLVAMKEVFAKGLYETGKFYERKKKPHASAIYYSDAMVRYPNTMAAQKSKARLSSLDVDMSKIVASR